MFKFKLRLLIALLSIFLILLGIILGEYETVRNIVRVICTSCIGLGG